VSAVTITIFVGILSEGLAPASASAKVDMVNVDSRVDYVDVDTCWCSLVREIVSELVNGGACGELLLGANSSETPRRILPIITINISMESSGYQDEHTE
jgi:hypothetical protein